MGCGALVSFLSSLAAGKNSVQRIGDVFSRGAVKPDAERRPVSALQLARANGFTDDIAVYQDGIEYTIHFSQHVIHGNERRVDPHINGSVFPLHDTQQFYPITEFTGMLDILGRKTGK